MSASLFKRKNLALQIVASALVLVGLAAGVTIVSSKTAVLIRPDAATLTPIRNGGDCTNARHSCLVGSACEQLPSGYNFKYMCVDTRCLGSGSNEISCVGSGLYDCQDGSYVKEAECGKIGCNCKDTNGIPICCNWRLNTPTPKSSPKPSPTPIVCSKSGGSCIDPHYCCSGFNCNTSNVCVSPTSKPSPTKTPAPTVHPTATPVCGIVGKPACVQ